MVTAQLAEVDVDRCRITLSIKALQPDPLLQTLERMLPAEGGDDQRFVLLDRDCCAGVACAGTLPVMHSRCAYCCYVKRVIGTMALHTRHLHLNTQHLHLTPCTSALNTHLSTHAFPTGTPWATSPRPLRWQPAFRQPQGSNPSPWGVACAAAPLPLTWRCTSPRRTPKRVQAKGAGCAFVWWCDWHWTCRRWWWAASRGGRRLRIRWLKPWQP